MSIFYVYGYYEPDCVNPFYIGKGKELRAINHIEQPSVSNLNDIFHRKLRKMKREGIKPIIVILSEGLEEHIAIQLEIALIKKYGRRNNGTGCLCNMTDGGDGGLGGIKGTQLSIETRIKISQSRRGFKHTEESKKRIRETTNEKKADPIESYNLQTEKTVKQYLSIRETLLDGFDKRSIYKCLRGLKKSHGGLGWRYQTKEHIDSDWDNPEHFANKPFD